VTYGQNPSVVVRTRWGLGFEPHKNPKSVLLKFFLFYNSWTINYFTNIFISKDAQWCLLSGYYIHYLPTIIVHEISLKNSFFLIFWQFFWNFSRSTTTFSDVKTDLESSYHSLSKTVLPVSLLYLPKKLCTKNWIFMFLFLYYNSSNNYQNMHSRYTKVAYSYRLQIPTIPSSSRFIFHKIM